MFRLLVTSPKNPTWTHPYSHSDSDTVVPVFTGLIVALFVGAYNDDDAILYDAKRTADYFETEGLTEDEECELINAVRQAVALYRA